MRKLFSVPKLILGRFHERDEWREPLSRKDLLEEMKAADRRYEARLNEGEPDWSWLQTHEQAEEELQRGEYEDARA